MRIDYSPALERLQLNGEEEGRKGIDEEGSCEILLNYQLFAVHQAAFLARPASKRCKRLNFNSCIHPGSDRCLRL